MYTNFKRLRLFCAMILAISVPLLHAQTPPASGQMWQQLLAKADSLQKVAQYDSALVKVKQALEITERDYGKEDTSVAWVLGSFGTILRLQANYSVAESLLVRSLQIAEKAFSPEHPSIANSLNSLAILYTDQGRYADAERLLMRALKIEEKTLGAEHPNIATIQTNIANLYRDQGRYADAEPLYERALQIREKILGVEHPDVTASLNNLAVLYWNQGRYADSEPLLLRALQIREKVLGAEHPDVATSLSNLAVLYGVQGRFADAEPLFLRALQIREKVLGAEHPVVATSLNNLASLYRNQGRYANAESLLLRALQINEKMLGAQHPDVALSLNNLGNLYWEQGRYDDAEPLLLRALQIKEKVLGADHPDVAASLTDLAGLYRYQDRYAEAEPLYQRAAQIYEKVLGADDPDLAYSLVGLASLYSYQERYVDAERLYQRTLTIREKTFGPEHPLVAATLAGIAFCAQQRGQFFKAETAESRAWNIRRKNFHEGAAVLAERNALEYSQFLQLESSDYLSILLRLPDGQSKSVSKLADVIVASKSQIFDGILARNHSLVVDSDSTAIKLSDTLRIARFALSKLYEDGPGKDGVEVYRRDLDSATKEKERLEVDIARRSPSFRKDLELWNAKSGQVIAALPNGAALVEFMRYDQRINFNDTEPCYLALVLTTNGTPSVFSLGPAAPIDAAVGRYRQHFADVQTLDTTAYAVVSEGVYGLVWRPLAGLLVGASAVFIAPDGQLNLMSFAGLKDDSGRYLIEDYPIHYLSTGRDLIRLQDKPSSGSGLLAMGDPDFDLSFKPSALSNLKTNVSILMSVMNLRSACDELNKLNVGALPGTRTEVSAVGTQWTQTRSEPITTYLGADATEENFKKNAPGKRVIHLATHGFYIGDECKSKQDTRSPAGESEGFVGENPLLQCGFLLAGANKHGEGAKETNRQDGIITAEDVAGLNLQGTDLVVLSSCESGLGEVKSGEGVYGLRRAFQMAGARTVISALWPIDDKSTAEFMGQLFSAKDETVPQTMQRVALNRISSLRAQGKSDHPFYWAAFVATGDWNLR